MALKEVRKCDVYGTEKGVEQFRLTLTREPNDALVFDRSVDLSPRALDRLKRQLLRYTSPPGKKEGI